MQSESRIRSPRYSSFAAASPRIAAAVLSVAVVSTVLAVPAIAGAQNQADFESRWRDEQSVAPGLPPHMPQSVRAAVDKVVVIAGQRPTGQAIGGTYAKETPGLVGGMDEGSRIGQISKQIGGVPINIPFPILTLPGAIFGGLTGAARRQVQDFRDALTEELARAGSQPLHNDGVALDVFWGLRELPQLDSKLFAPTTPIPEDTDAVLFVAIDGVELDVQGKNAVVTTTASAVLRRLSDGADVYETTLRYQDRDSLGNWTKDDNALWRDYANFARHYLGRAVAADAFGRVELQHDWQVAGTDTASVDRKDRNNLVSRSTTPTLAWELAVTGGELYGPWTGEIVAETTRYDVEVYDNRRLVYFQEQVPDARHTVAMDLEPCTTYRWSVRPAYHVDGRVYFGDWMRFPPEVDTEGKTGDDVAPAPAPIKGLVGREASVAPAYTQDFATLEMECRR